MITNYWASYITLNQRGMFLPGFSSNEPIHITLDGRQQTITVGQTTHHTTGTNINNNNNNNTEYPERGSILDEGEETDFREFKTLKCSY